MNTNQILPDDPRLTAYALDEMAADERAEFEKLLNADPAARRAVEEIRATGAMLTGAFEAEPDPVAGREPATESKSKFIRFPQFYYMVSGLAAACFAVFFVYWQQNQPVPAVPKQYVEVDLDAFKPAQSAVTFELPVAATPPAVMMGREIPVADAIEPGALPSFKNDGQAVAVTDDLSLAAKSAAVSGGSMSYAPSTEVHLSAPAAAPATVGSVTAANEEQVVALSSFSVSSSADGYIGGSTLAGARLRRNESNAEMWVARQAVQGIRMNFAALQEPGFNTEDYGHRKDNDYARVADHPLSTFSVDVDTAAYANVRRFLVGGERPPVDAVRIEELINYFSYAYAQPMGNEPFAASLEVAAAPWAPEHRLVRIGLKGREVSDVSRPAANLVFLLDVSGSMRHANKLPLVKQSLRLLVNKLRADDRVAIAVYAGSSGLALPSTPAARKAEILEAIERLEAGGSTNGGMGIHLAYDIAKANFIADGVNRVILATDGDFNVGTTGGGDLMRLVEEKAKGGVFLSVLGFGMGNLKDGALEQIADKGNGNYAYIDSLDEARKALVEQAGGTLVTIAKDVKIQVEFNPAQVAAYRLIGYENRLLAKEDFNNDAVDAGEIGAGHTVTALYEIVPAGAELPGEAPAVDELKYQRTEDRGRKTEDRGRKASVSGELLTVKIRYKEPAGEVSSRLEFVLRDTGTRFEDASQDFKFAAAVAGFGMVLRDSPHKGSLTLAEVSAWGRAGTGNDAGGYRSEFLSLVEKAQAVMQ